MNGFGYLIIKWYLDNRRELPWRQTRDPYRIWVSEVILQQTRVEQGLAYYGRFLGRFPDLRSLAEAPEEDVMKAWQGLGYYTRARNMHYAARSVMERNRGVFPASYKEIRKLKGVGEYSAGAIASIAFGEPHPAIDGNVLRVVARFLGIREPVGKASSRKKTREFLEREMDREDPGTFNQAVMELGALVCKPRQPACHGCPLNELCYALRNDLTGSLPVIGQSRPPSVRHLHYFVIISGMDDERFLWLNKRTGPGIWKNLYDFPLIESDRELSGTDIERSGEWEKISGPHGLKISEVISVPPYMLSHRELRVRFLIIFSDHFSNKKYKKVKFCDLHNYPVPRLIENFLKKISERPGIFSKFPD